MGWRSYGRDGGDRDAAWAAGRGVARHRPAGLPDKPDGRGQLSGAAFDVAQESDHADAMPLANILRTDIHAHRSLPADAELTRAVAVLPRAHHDGIWRRFRAGNELRSLLR